MSELAMKKLIELGKALFICSKFFDHKHGCFEKSVEGIAASVQILEIVNHFGVATGYKLELEASGDGIRLWDDTRGEYFWPANREPRAWYEAIGCDMSDPHMFKLKEKGTR